MNKNLKTIVLGLALVTPLATLAHATDTHVETAPTQAVINVDLSGIKVQKGTVYVGLYNSEANYNSSDDGIKKDEVLANAETIYFSFSDLPAGEYAIRLFHDVDDNGTLNVNSFRMPTEPYAFSNNAKGSFGPAKWSVAKFTITAGTTTHAIKFD